MLFFKLSVENTPMTKTNIPKYKINCCCTKILQKVQNNSFTDRLFNVTGISKNISSSLFLTLILADKDMF